MGNNIIFYFSGTGNSLQAAREIASVIDAEVVSMGRKFSLGDRAFERIGFVFPTYGTAPRRVREFVSELDFSGQKQAYLFAIATCGRQAGNSLPDMNAALATKGVKLHFGAPLVMFINTVTMFDITGNPEEKAKESSAALKPLIEQIHAKQENEIPKGKALIKLMTKMTTKNYAGLDQFFNVSDACNECKTCEAVCPVSNIEMHGGKPVYKHHCEQCLACLHWCPTRAINFKDKTQKRGRYHHPYITVEDMMLS